MRSYERMKRKMDDIVLIVTMDLVSTEIHSNYMYTKALFLAEFVESTIYYCLFLRYSIDKLLRELGGSLGN